MLEQLKDYNLEQIKQELNSPLVQWVGILIAVIILWFMIFQPYLEWRSGELAQIKSDVMQVEKLQSLEYQRTQLSSQFNEVDEELRSTKVYLLQSRSFNQGISEQVSLLEGIFRPLDLSFGSRRFGEPSLSPWLGENISSQWSFIGSSQQMLDFIYALAHSQQLVVPTRLELKKGTDQRVELNANFTSYRYLPLKDLKFRSLQDAS